jgi:hypothetical protein
MVIGSVVIPWVVLSVAIRRGWRWQEFQHDIANALAGKKHCFLARYAVILTGNISRHTLLVTTFSPQD